MCDTFGLHFVHLNIVSIITQFPPEQTYELFMIEKACDGYDTRTGDSAKMLSVRLELHETHDVVNIKKVLRNLIRIN